MTAGAWVMLLAGGALICVATFRWTSRWLGDPLDDLDLAVACYRPTSVEPGPPALPDPPMLVLRSGPPTDDHDHDEEPIDQDVHDRTCDHADQVTLRALCQKDGERLCIDCGLTTRVGRPDMTWPVKQLRSYADLHHIDLTDARLKADVLQTITDHLNEDDR